jgi:serine/threonine protein kinase
MTKEFSAMINEFKLLEDLGVGGTSSVKLGYCDKDYGDIFAIKIMKKPTGDLDCPSEVLEKEFAVLKRLDHPHIIKLHEVC